MKKQSLARGHEQVVDSLPGVAESKPGGQSPVEMEPIAAHLAADVKFAKGIGSRVK